MKVLIRPWPECLEEFKTFGIKLGEYVDLTNEQMEKLSSKFDMAIVTQKYPAALLPSSSLSGDIIDKVLYLAPAGRGFGQR